MREFIKSFFSFGLASTIERLIAFILLPIYTRYFTTTEFGVIDLTQVVLSIISIFAFLQLETALQRYYYEYDEKEKGIFLSTIIIVITLLSLLLTVLVFIFSKEASLLIFKKAEYSNLIKVASLQLPFSNYSVLALILLRYEKKNVRFTAMILIKVFLTVLFICLFVIWQKQGIYGVFYAQLVSLSVSSILLFFSVKEFTIFQLSYEFLKRSINYAIPQFPARIGSVLLSYANRFFMVGYLTIASIGIYSFSLKLATIVQLVYTTFVLAWAPFMHEQQKNPEHKKIFAYILLVVAGPVFLLVSIVSIFSKEIVQTIASKQFFSAYHYLGGLCLYFSLLIFKEIVDIGPKYTEKTRYLTYTFFLSVIANITSLYFLIKLYGLYGVVYSMLFTNVVLLVSSWIISNKLYHISHNIYKFILMAVPAFALAISSMYQLPSLLIRISILIIILSFYGYSFFKSFKKQKLWL